MLVDVSRHYQTNIHQMHRQTFLVISPTAIEVDRPVESFLYDHPESITCRHTVDKSSFVFRIVWINCVNGVLSNCNIEARTVCRIVCGYVG